MAKSLYVVDDMSKKERDFDMLDDGNKVSFIDVYFELQRGILYMLEAVEQTSLETIELINNISELMIKTQDTISEKLPKIYSKDLVEILFMHPYTKVEFLVDRLNITRKTASKYLSELEKIDILKNIQIKNSKYFINVELFDLLRKGI